MKPLAELERALCYSFRNLDLLEHALTHSSFAHEQNVGEIKDNERLEFLGDSVLGFLISNFLYEAHPNINEGELSKLKSYLVSSANLIHYSKRLALGDYLRLGKGEEKTGGREKPALLVDTFEAVLAAIYIDGGLEAIQDIVYRLFKHQVENVNDTQGRVANFKSVLQESLQSQNEDPIRYKVVEESGPDHQRMFTVEVLTDGKPIASGRGVSKKAAEQAAAREALEILRNEESDREK